VNETFTVSINSSGATEISPASATATITDDDTSSVALSKSADPIAEAGGTSTITATLSTTNSRTVTTTLDRSTSTATLSDDYTASNASIAIAAGATTGTSVLTAVQDVVVDPGETIITTISGTPTNGAVGSPSSVTVTITDDDAAPAAPAAAISKGVSLSGGASLR